MPIIGAAYLRCSDPRQDKSIEQQREEIERRCATEGEEYALRALQGGAAGRQWFARGRVQVLGPQGGSDKQKTLDG